METFMQNWSCMHLCGHSSVKLLWSCDARAQDSCPLFKSTQCFQNMFFYQFVHSSESIFGCSEKLSQHLPFKCIYTFFQKLVMISEFILFQRKVGSYLLSQARCFFARQLLFFIIFFLFFLLFLSLLVSLFLFLFLPPFFMFICSFPLSSFFLFLVFIMVFVRFIFRTTFLNETLHGSGISNKHYRQ